MAMTARAHTPVQDAYRPLSPPTDSILLNRSYSSRSGSRPNSFIASNSGYNYAHGAVGEPPATIHNPRFHEEFDAASQRGSVAIDGPSTAAVHRSASQMSHSRSTTPTRSTTLKKRSSLSRKSSMHRSGSRRSLRAGSVRSLVLGDREKYGVEGADDSNSAFHIPIPTSGSPTEVMAQRFQAWRKILKDLIVFFKEVQRSYETRSKLYLSASNVINNSPLPPSFLKSGGLADATEILRDFHRQGYLEANKAAEVESEVVNQLMGLRNDLQKKTKEIKSLHGDFRNSVDKEVEGTRKTVRQLHEALGLVDTDPSATSGKGDPFIVRLNVDRQIEKQIEEENYLHRAFLNLENSGRELESIVVSEIQKAYNAYASILKREADEAYDTVEKLRAGPISMPHDHEWNHFVANTDELVDPRVPLRNVENITYPGKDHPAAAEVRSGMLERKSKYLKSYTPGWYVLSPTHLHEFKSADRVAWQTPVMSLYLPEQKLGSHSQPDSTSHKFMLKGRQTGTMHRGHSWVFRAESHETMMAWYEDIESLISKTGEARNAYVRRHVRTVSGTSVRTSIDGIMDEDEADRTPYSAEAVVLNQERPTSEPRQPGGRFPSDVQIDRHVQAPLSPSSGESSGGHDMLAGAGELPDGVPFHDGNPNVSSNESRDASYGPPVERHDAYYGEWMGPAEIAARQKQLQQGNSGGDQGGAARSDVGGNDAHPILFAGMGSVSSRDPSVARQRNRRESASTAPTTTNVTDHTHNTIPTSVEGDHDTPMVGVGGVGYQNAGDYKNDQGLSTVDSATVTPLSDIASEEAYNGSYMRRPGNMRRTSSQQKKSVSALELQIPGHYPPANHIPA
ncbi:SLM1 family PH domain-containing protein [Aspergillus clavatus NRRL 1]|uniref:PH domain protein n=1 Tax=Aspergillus clavatus (strain ATCC 1007 / CBS 513.65 / DSM 816 / NCTC 3887 / NRRL 1 / QM 1276 / 107) TaxID=344612 RepID=A1CU71_ASPCL|nr:PH domain protein [Aspergillus clavatus NRRL 1]EAW06858.1 PH domain protein [Aspergillus clavatus NRRL 1]